MSAMRLVKAFELVAQPVRIWATVEGGSPRGWWFDADQCRVTGQLRRSQAWRRQAGGSVGGRRRLRVVWLHWAASI